MRTIALLIVFSFGGLAQTRDTAALFGTATDTQGGVVAAVTISLTNLNTANTRTTATDEKGGYIFGSLPVGPYKITAEQQGFRKYERTGILLTADDNVKVDLVLEVGDVKTTVVVNAESSLVETRSATLKDTVGQQRVIDLPLNGRNPADLALLAPGVVPSGNNTGAYKDNTVLDGVKQFSVSGGRNDNVRFTLDGGENMDPMLAYNMPFPFPDALQEFSFQTSNMTAEHGNSSGGAVNVVTKSGTNAIHGSAFWFVRNTALDATDFFSHQQDQLKQNQTGFTVGGPIIKNKLFFFGGFQRLWIRSAPGNAQSEALTTAERTGNFSADGVTITDPLTGAPFPNNTIPQSRLDPAALAILKVAPLPGPDGFAHYSTVNQENGKQYIFKGDYMPSTRHLLMLRYFQSDQSTPYHSPPDNIFASQFSTLFNAKNVTLSYTFVIEPTLQTHTQLTADHARADARSDFAHTIRDFVPNVYAASNDISVYLANSGVSFHSPNQALFGRATEELQHDWIWTKGSHVFTWGTALSWEQYNEINAYNASGNWTFNGFVTGFDRADFMLGQFSSFTQNNGEFENRRQPLRGFYFGDSWRATRRLTFSFGLRYEPYAFFTDTKNRNQTFSLQNYQRGIKSKIFLDAPAGLLYAGDADPRGGTIGRSVTKSDLDNLAPRFGFAWDPFGNGKDSVRGGYAVFYQMPALQFQNNSNDVSPFSYSVQFNSGTFDDPYKGRENENVYPLKGFPPNTPFPSPLFTQVLPGNWRSEYMQNWSLTVEHTISRDTLLRVAYVGTKGTHLTAWYDQNAPIYNFTLTTNQNIATIDARRPIQGYQSIVNVLNGLNSSYNSLQVSMNKRYSNGLTASAAYTWSKTLDYFSINTYGGYEIANPFNFFFRRSVSDQDRPQRFVSSFVWDLPAPVGKDAPAVAKALTRNWKVSGILTLQSGSPFTINAPGNPVAGAGTAYADLIGVGNPVLDTSRSKGEKIAEYFDITRFSNPAAGAYGTLGRNALRGPGYANLDASMVKGFRLPPLGEAGLAQLRFEVFNVFNRTNFATPVQGITNPLFGHLIATDGGSRILQLALRFEF